MLTDWPLERAAGEAIGLELDGEEGRDAFLWNRKTGDPWMPLWSATQAYQLLRELHLHIDQRPGKQISAQDPAFEILVYGDLAKGDHALNHAIVACAAQINGRRRAPGTGK